MIIRMMVMAMAMIMAMTPLKNTAIAIDTRVAIDNNWSRNNSIHDADTNIIPFKLKRRQGRVEHIEQIVQQPYNTPRRQKKFITYKVAQSILQGCAEIDFSVTAYIGEQQFEMLLDTGSSAMAVASQTCENCDMESTTYVPGLNAQDTGQTATQYYADGSGWSGQVYWDVVSLFPDGKNAISMNIVAVESQADGFFTNFDCRDGLVGLNLDYQGIVGFASPALVAGSSSKGLANTSSYIFSYFQHYPDQVQQFACEFCEFTGNLFIGGYIPQYAAVGASPLFTNTINLYSTKEGGFWQVNFIDIGINGKSLGCANALGFTIVDTGTTLLQLPTPVFNTLANALAADPWFQLYFGSPGAQFFDSNSNVGVLQNVYNDDDDDTMNANLPKLLVVLDGVTLEIPAISSYLMKIRDTDPYTTLPATFYMPGIVNSDVKIGSWDTLTIIGLAVLQSVLTVFDIKNQRIGFVNKSHADCPAGWGVANVTANSVNPSNNSMVCSSACKTHLCYNGDCLDNSACQCYPGWGGTQCTDVVITNMTATSWSVLSGYVPPVPAGNATVSFKGSPVPGIVAAFILPASYDPFASPQTAFPEYGVTYVNVYKTGVNVIDFTVSGALSGSVIIGVGNGASNYATYSQNFQLNSLCLPNASISFGNNITTTNGTALSCSNFGICILGACSCQEGYWGSQCEIGPCTANGMICDNHGTCNPDGSCSCNTGFSGTACQTGKECPLSCAHGGIVDNDCQSCLCYGNWNGQTCSNCGLFCPFGSSQDPTCSFCECTDSTLAYPSCTSDSISYLLQITFTISNVNSSLMTYVQFLEGRYAFKEALYLEVMDLLEANDLISSISAVQYGNYVVLNSTTFDIAMDFTVDSISAGNAIGSFLVSQVPVSNMASYSQYNSSERYSILHSKYTTLNLASGFATIYVSKVKYASLRSVSNGILTTTNIIIIGCCVGIGGFLLLLVGVLGYRRWWHIKQQLISNNIIDTTTHQLISNNIIDLNLHDLQPSRQIDAATSATMNEEHR